MHSCTGSFLSAEVKGYMDKAKKEILVIDAQHKSYGN